MQTTQICKIPPTAINIYSDRNLLEKQKLEKSGNCKLEFGLGFKAADGCWWELADLSFLHVQFLATQNEVNFKKRK